MTKRLLVFRHGHDISDRVTTRNGRALPGGWSQHELVWMPNATEHGPGEPEHIGWLESGYPSDFAEGFIYRIEQEISP